MSESLEFFRDQARANGYLSGFTAGAVARSELLRDLIGIEIHDKPNPSHVDRLALWAVLQTAAFRRKTVGADQ